MAQTVFVASEFRVENRSRRATPEDADALWSGRHIPKSQVRHETKEERSDCRIDGDALAQRVNEAIESLLAKGLTIVSVTPVISGRHDVQTSLLPTDVAGYGFSYTEGMLIVAV
ncbi:hypothetical protein [Ferrimonas sp. YFM]|uniref:hypothetical protein n=1 Tax=Ferrimonas sp. YFM TaxID=3028878 RepID=UPI002572C8EE|nr:hypothetical protein [Ferrimonas sp. YFM]BDY04866.1 hypothetical protein F0521_19070 [Ferrimonas sp. YFM]